MSILNKVVTSGGDLSKLTATEQGEYYKAVCDSVGLNPLTEPFRYIVLNGRLQLYATRACTEQLRKVNGISLQMVSSETIGDVYVVRMRAIDKTGRTDESTGIVSITGLKSNDLANALMKAETKSKRRVTLSISGLGYLDESEIESIPHNAVSFEGVPEPPAKPDAKPQATPIPEAKVESKPEAKAEVKPEVKPEAKSEPNPKEAPGSQVKPDSTPEPVKPENKKLPFWEVLVDGNSTKVRGKDEFKVDVIVASSDEFTDTIEMVAPLEYRDLATQGSALRVEGSIKDGVLEAKTVAAITDEDFICTLLADAIETKMAYNGKPIERPMALVDAKAPVEGYKTFMIGAALDGLKVGDVIAYEIAQTETDEEKQIYKIFVKSASKYEQKAQ
jgi:hypothetical protein